MTVVRNPMNKEAKYHKISTKTEYAVDLDNGYYHDVYILLKLNKKDSVNRKYYQT